MTKHATPPTYFAEFEPPLQTRSDASPWRGLSANRPFFENVEISAIMKRAVFYARAGIPIHFQGGAGLGKTSLALAIAAKLGRPVSFMAGNDWLDAEDLIGKEIGHSTSSVVDKYIQRVRRTESNVRYEWAHSILADAMERGHTLVYDEFTRSSAKANGILLSVLEDGVLVSTNQVNERTYLHAHADFRIVLTSNPHDYSGINETPDALFDRMVTFNLNTYSAATRIGVVVTRTGLPPDISGRIVRLVDGLQDGLDGDQKCSMRAAILVARIAAMRLTSGMMSDALLAQITADVLNGRGLTLTAGHIARQLAAMPASPEDIA